MWTAAARCLSLPPRLDHTEAGAPQHPQQRGRTVEANVRRSRRGAGGGLRAPRVALQARAGIRGGRGGSGGGGRKRQVTTTQGTPRSCVNLEQSRNPNPSLCRQQHAPCSTQVPCGLTLPIGRAAIVAWRSPLRRKREPGALGGRCSSGLPCTGSGPVHGTTRTAQGGRKGDSQYPARTYIARHHQQRWCSGAGPPPGGRVPHATDQQPRSHADQ